MNKSCVNIRQEIDIVAARQLGRDLAKEVGFSAVDQARFTTAVSEIARNIYLYANEGKICFDITQNMNHTGLRLTATDSGPGIKDISKAMEDGYTTSGGLGAGLPGVKRLMDEFDISSEENVGTKIMVIKWKR
ncbi:Non-specific serine/threonine protein kinase [Lentibacillus sp. JNUCC-1]|uniref:anti-sigma regulatory factor n=1 Tax=Lentibacillus sp. JNUCC-1 TaxID=2654513 RepID=UPI0012E82EAD|nr:anti-sigma regulatory factor [Lentibacillus sp. JNUCC-1]MUV38505.1 Non-specific serine/threonine protein kinase [Lentibacillus sp. JNUCC-1]